MKYTLLTIVTLLLGSGMGNALAYSSPEDVLFGEINSRRAEETVRQREAERVQKLKESAPEPEQTPTIEPEIPEDTPEEIPDDTDPGQYFFLDAQTAKLLERLSNRQSGRTNVMHPGAPLETVNDYPLAPTGPGAAALAITLIGALGWTGYRVWRAENIG